MIHAINTQSQFSSASHKIILV